MRKNNCNRFNNIGFDEFSNRSCCEHKEGICEIEEAIEDISDGIEQVREGLHDIHTCQIREGIHKCRESVCHIEASLQDIVDELHMCHVRNCDIRMIQHGIREIHRGDKLVLKGVDDIRCCQECRGEREIAEGLCEEEKGLHHIIEGLKHMLNF